MHSIRRHIDYAAATGYIGYVDLGVGSETIAEAKECWFWENSITHLIKKLGFS